MSCPNQELFAINRGILQTRMDQRGDHMKMNFDYFQIQMLQTVKVGKEDKKKWRHVSSFHVSFLNYGP